MILQNNTREFINFFFEILWAAKEALSVNKIVDSQKNLFYSSRYQWDSNSSKPPNYGSNISYNNSKLGSTKKKLDLKITIKSLSKQDLVDIFEETSRSFKNVILPRSIFENMIDRNIEQFKNQLERVIMNSHEDKDHKHEIEKIYYEIQKDRDTFEMNKVTFYYFFKMNSLFSNWGVFDYNTFRERCKSMIN